MGRSHRLVKTITVEERMLLVDGKRKKWKKVLFVSSPSVLIADECYKNNINYAILPNFLFSFMGKS